VLVAPGADHSVGGGVLPCAKAEVAAADPPRHEEEKYTVLTTHYLFDAIPVGGAGWLRRITSAFTKAEVLGISAAAGLSPRERGADRSRIDLSERRD